MLTSGNFQQFLCTILSLCINIFHTFSMLEHVLFPNDSSRLSAVGNPAVISPDLLAKIRDMKHLGEDGDGVLAGRKENLKYPCLKGQV